VAATRAAKAAEAARKEAAERAEYFAKRDAKDAWRAAKPERKKAALERAKERQRVARALAEGISLDDLASIEADELAARKAATKLKVAAGNEARRLAHAEWKAGASARQAQWDAGAPARQAERDRQEALEKARQDAQDAERATRLAELDAQDAELANDEEVLRLMPKIGMTGLLWWRKYGAIGRGESVWIGPVGCVVTDVAEDKGLARNRPRSFHVRIDDDMDGKYAWGDARGQACSGPRAGTSFKVFRAAGVRLPRVWKNNHMFARSTGIANVELDIEGEAK